MCSGFDIKHTKFPYQYLNILVFLLLLFVLFCPSLSWAQEGYNTNNGYACPGMDVLKERYQGDCFPCEIVNVLLASFMRAASQVYDVSKEAGNKLLLLGSAIWVAFWALRKVSSLANVEPSSMTNELIIFFGKVLVAYCFINAGIGTLVSYAINPILGAGADFGSAMLLETEGIDIILGGHSHDMVKDIKDGENLLKSKSGEPVVITQAGKDGENVGVLNVEWTEDGVLTKIQNNLINTRKFNRTLPSRTAVEEVIGKPEILGTVKYADPEPENRLVANNPHGNLIADAMRHELGTEIAILNAGNIRGHFDVGTVDSRLINDITPFEDKMIVGSLSEKDIVDAIKVGAKSLVAHNSKPGILLIAGMNYTMNDKGELLSLNYIDRNGVEHPIDVKNPDPNRKFTCAMDDFFAMGGDNYLPSNENPDFIIKKYNVDKNKLACDYIKKMDKPLEIRDDKRVKVVKS